MATLRLDFHRFAEALRAFFAPRTPLPDARSVFEEADKYRNLPTGVALLSFFASAGFAIVAFFWINEAVLWVGMSDKATLLAVASAWILIFPIWALVFLVFMSVLRAMGVCDIQAAVKYRLSRLALDQGELRDLGEFVESRAWRHRSIFKDVIDDLSQAGLQH